MSAIFTLLASAALAQSVTVTSAVSATSAVPAGNATATTTGSPSGTTNISLPTGIPETLSPACQSTIQKYENANPQGCNLPQSVSVTNVTAGNYTSVLSSLNPQVFDAICSSTCQASIKPIVTDIANACKDDSPYMQYYPQLLTAFFDVACVKDGNDYCLIKELQDISPILVNPSQASALASNTTFICSKCVYSQITVLDKDVTSFPQNFQAEYNAFSSSIKNQCTSQYKSYTSSGAVAQAAGILSALSVVFIAFF
ncbi:hypothetical protein HDV01_002044 [Terramyces sp. JEL0728]|nr:hypothetical protein HDV01_002044 [Terramyces sp. JEL0728]